MQEMRKSTPNDHTLLRRFFDVDMKFPEIFPVQIMSTQNESDRGMEENLKEGKRGAGGEKWTAEDVIYLAKTGNVHLIHQDQFT